jgi:superfamily II DNA or RNA helicase
MSIIGNRILYNDLSNINSDFGKTSKTKSSKSKSTKTIRIKPSNSLTILPHQLIAYDHLISNKAILLYHKMGSGKTISSLYAAIKFDLPTIIIGPKSSKKSFFDDLNKLANVLKFDQKKFEFYTYQKIQNLLQTNFDLFNNKIVIIDEAHHLRSQTSLMMFIINSLPFANKVILLSGTPIINHPIDFAVLLNIIKNSEVITTDRSLFDFYYVEGISNLDQINTDSSYEVRFKNIEELKQKISNAVSFYDPTLSANSESNTNYLKIKTEYPTVKLSKAQLIEYKNYIVRLINPITKRIIHLETDINADDYNVDFITLDIKKKNAFLTATRQLSNTIDNDHNSPKIVEITNHIKNGPKPCVVYSNFLANGIYPISLRLNELGIRHKIIKGSTSEEKMDLIINEYNDRNFDVLLISSAASESISLLNTRQIHIMEPHFNEAKINQVIGRAIRYKSHSKLSQAERNITIYHWCSIFPDLIKYKTADEYLIYLGRKKQNLIDKFISIIKSVSI